MMVTSPVSAMIPMHPILNSRFIGVPLTMKRCAGVETVNSKQPQEGRETHPFQAA